MSWSIKIYAKKSDAPALVNQWLRQQHSGVADFIIAQVALIPDVTPGTACPWDAADHVRIEGHGHGGGIGKLEIEAVRFMTPPPPPAPPVDNKYVVEGAEQFSAPQAVS